MTITAFIHRVKQEIGASLSTELGGDDITDTQIMVLKAVADHEGASQTRVTMLTGVDRSTLADVVRRLVAANYISRKRSKSDARAYMLSITATGTRALAKGHEALKRAEAEVAKKYPSLRKIAEEAEKKREITTRQVPLMRPAAG